MSWVLILWLIALLGVAFVEYKFKPIRNWIAKVIK